MSTSLLDAARQYYSWGANVNAIARGGKDPINKWKHLQSERQTDEELTSYGWTRAGGVGINNGHGGFHSFDLDAIKEKGCPPLIVSDDTIDTLLDLLRLPRDYAWVWRTRSKAGWGLEFHCDELLPPGVLPAKKDEAGVAWGWPAEGSDWHHLELRYAHCQTLLPPSDGYAWRHAPPTEPPASVPIHRVLAAFFALCPPPPQTLGSIDESTKAQIKERFDLVDYAVKQFGGETQVERDGEIRVLGHSGLLINEDKGLWHCFGDEIGGDCFELVAYAKYRTPARNLNGKSAEILSEAAEFVGVALPERKHEHTVTATGLPATAAAVPPRFTIASEDVLYDLPPLAYLDRDLVLCASAFHLIYGASGSGKTFFAIERALRQVSLGRRVLYIPTEDVSGLRYRVAAWRLAHPGATGKLTFLQMPKGLDLQDHAQVAELIETIEPYQYDHIVLDTLREAHSGDENSSQDTARINRAIQRLVSTGAAVDVVHHTGVAGERPRGSTALFGNCDVVIKVENDDGLIRANFDKIRNAAPRDAIAFGLVAQDTGLLDSDEQSIGSCILRPAEQFSRRDAPMNANQRKILALLALSIFSSTGAKTAQVKNAAELPERTVYNALSWLKNKGYISQGEKGDPYYITPAGQAQLGPEYGTASGDSAAGSPTASTASGLPVDCLQSVPLHTATAATANTLRVGSGGSEVAGSEQQLQSTKFGRGRGRVITGKELEDLYTRDNPDTTFSAFTGETDGLFPDDTLAQRVERQRSRREELHDEYERLIGPMRETLTLEALEEAVRAAQRMNQVNT